jgi:hypothetical protein
LLLSASPGTNTVTTQPCGQDVATFTVSGSLTAFSSVAAVALVDYLVVAGGGSGGLLQGQETLVEVVEPAVIEHLFQVEQN